MNSKTFEEYLRALMRAQTGRQTECINTFQFYWKMLKSRLENNSFPFKMTEISCFLKIILSVAHILNSYSYVTKLYNFQDI